MGDFEQYRTNAHEPGEETLHVSIVDGFTGDERTFESIRPLKDEQGNTFYIAQTMVTDEETKVAVPEEVILPTRFETLKEHSVDIIHRHKGKIALAGTLTFSVLAGAGILVRRHKKTN